MYLQTLGSLRLIGITQGFALKELLLLAYLALEGSESRKVLNQLFYPGKSDANLRGVLAKLTEAGLIEKDRAGAYFVGGCAVDALELTTAFEQEDFDKVHQLYRDQRDRFMPIAKGEYGGQLLDWLERKGKELGNLAFEAKLELLEGSHSKGQISQTAQMAEQAASLLLSGLAEGHRFGVWRLLQTLSSGDTKSKLTALARKQFGLDFSQPLEGLLQGQVAGDFKPRYSLGFRGRRSEVRELLMALSQPDLAFVQVVGPGGYGKSALGQRAALEHIWRGGRFAGALFVDLEGNTLDGLMGLPQDLLNLLPQPVRRKHLGNMTSFDSFAGRLGYLLREVLSEHPVLLGLDGLERHLDGAGRFTSDGLLELFDLWFRHSAGSCLLATTRRAITDSRLPPAIQHSLGLSKGIEREAFLPMLDELEVWQYLPQRSGLREELGLWCDYSPFVAQNLVLRLQASPKGLDGEMLEQLTRQILRDPARVGLQQMDGLEREILATIALCGVDSNMGFLQVVIAADVSKAIARLQASRVVEVAGSSYAIHETYRETLLADLSHTQQIQVYQKAAAYFAAQSQQTPQPLEFTDLQPYLRWYRYTLKTEDYDEAAEVFLKFAFRLIRLGLVGLLRELGERLFGRVQKPVLAGRVMNVVALAIGSLGYKELAIATLEQARQVVFPFLDTDGPPAMRNLRDYYIAFGSNIALILLELGRPHEALPYFQAVLEWDKVAGATAGESATNCTMLGMAYVGMEAWDEAEHWLVAANRHFDQIQDPREFGSAQQPDNHDFHFQAVRYIGLARVCQARGHIEEAREWFLQALAITERTRDTDQRLESLQALADLEFAQSQPELAVEYLQTALEVAEEAGQWKTQRGLLERLVQCRPEYAHKLARVRRILGENSTAPKPVALAD